MNVNVSTHLQAEERINLGSYYTPQRYVSLVGEWLARQGVDATWTIADLSCGYGAFLRLKRRFPESRFIGNDIDAEASARARTNFPHIELHTTNCLHRVSRRRYGIDSKIPLVIVGNPPYNDITSIVGKGIKANAKCTIDDDLACRDIGISCLLSYNKLRAELVAVLHPLSYLIKETNFRACRAFFESYSLQEHIIFSSHEFAETSRLAAFPVIVALYRRNPQHGLTYREICGIRFKTVEGDEFSLSDRDYIGDHIAKYPSKKRYQPEMLFYTLRDVNALKRCRTFIGKRCANAVDVDPAKLSYYCYVDCFKRYAEPPYWQGNLDVPFLAGEFDALGDDFIAVAQYNNRDIFTNASAPDASQLVRVKEYISRVVQFAK